MRRDRAEAEYVPNNRLHVAVLFNRIGPYHFARLKAAAARLKVTAVEFTNVDRVYAWDLVQTSDDFNRVTLFCGNEMNDLTSRQISSRVAAALGQLRPDVIAVPGWSERCSLTGVRWCGEESIPVVMMSESTAWDEKRRWWKECVKRLLLKLCSTSFVGGRAHAGYLERLGVDPDSIFFGYDAVDNDYFSDNADEARGRRSEVRRRLGLPESYFLASARFVEKKNLLRLLEAYALYRDLAMKEETGKQKTEIWKLVLLGDGPLKPDLCHLISDLRLEDTVLLPGFKQYGELPGYYALASAFVHPSTTEQWGLVVNEAMASGLPVLVSNRCGCTADLVQEGKNGFMFDPYDVDEIAQLMLKISTFNFPISQFGSESARLISHWGTERFALGLKAAAEAAIGAGPIKTTLIQRVLLKALLAR